MVFGLWLNGLMFDRDSYSRLRHMFRSGHAAQFLTLAVHTSAPSSISA
jgi:hypothetical protein